eukprot:TRINITY_DN3893_c0_g1_i3.p1 TRINITY_DN3893_c0_g1~~TRINITY_DN3893_c0_g1_i3.p1  ORF type:complete len:1230 (+),score=216.41 TRINITY_DN3893_c0_g1_i3:123-3812(+)
MEGLINSTQAGLSSLCPSVGSIPEVSMRSSDGLLRQLAPSCYSRYPSRSCRALELRITSPSRFLRLSVQCRCRKNDLQSPSVSFDKKKGIKPCSVVSSSVACSFCRGRPLTLHFCDVSLIRQREYLPSASTADVQQHGDDGGTMGKRDGAASPFGWVNGVARALSRPGIVTYLANFFHFFFRRIVRFPPLALGALARAAQEASPARAMAAVVNGRAGVAGLADGNWWVVRSFREGLLQEVNALEARVQRLSDDQLRTMTELFKARLADKEHPVTLDEVQPAAFAVVREAARRTLGLRHFDVQIIGGGVLHAGSVAEMKTGEGKTLVSTLAAYLNALEGKGVHVVTPNAYLARRDAEWMGKVHNFLGLSVGIVEEEMSSEDKREGYACDITYTSSNELAFDFLRDNCVLEKQMQVMRWPHPLHYAIIDEFDSVIADEGGTPLIITQPDTVGFDKGKCIAAAYVASRLSQEENYSNQKFGLVNYTLDNNTKDVELTADGVDMAINLLESLDIDNPPRNDREFWASGFAPYIRNALKVKVHYLLNRDYIIDSKGEMKLIEQVTGRASNKVLSNGLHQALEAKENLKWQEITKEDPELKALLKEPTISLPRTVTAKITWTGLVSLYPKLAGMTGTAKAEEAYFAEKLDMAVVQIPSNRPNRRVDMPLRLAKSKSDKWGAVVDAALRVHKSTRPVLIGTTSVEDSEQLRARFGFKSKDVLLLNARPENASREAAIISQAGRKSSITIATNMAGRGTDIVLGGNPEMLAQDLLLQYVTGRNKMRLPYTLEAPVRRSLEHAKALWQRDVQGGHRDEEQYMHSLMTKVISWSPERVNKVIAECRKSDLPLESKARNALEDALCVLLHCLRGFCETDARDIKELGGLHVIGTEMQKSSRLDDQLRGRCARQGDPGSTQFIISLEDALFVDFKIDGFVKDLITQFTGGEVFEAGFATKQLTLLQSRMNEAFRESREAANQSLNLIEEQRKHVYQVRQGVMEATPGTIGDLVKKYVHMFVDDQVSRFCKPTESVRRWRIEELLKGIACLEPKDIPIDPSQGSLRDIDSEKLRAALCSGNAQDSSLFPRKIDVSSPQGGGAAAGKEEGDDNKSVQFKEHWGRSRAAYSRARTWLAQRLHLRFQQALEDGMDLEECRKALLLVLDANWRLHLVKVDRLYDAILFRQFGEMDPVHEFKRETFKLYEEMMRRMLRDFVVYALNLQRDGLVRPGLYTPGCNILPT